MQRSMLSTIDNPFDPFDNWREWFVYDEAAGYHTSSFLARLVNNSHELSEADQLQEVENAIDEAVRENVSGLYIKVTRDFPDS